MSPGCMRSPYRAIVAASASGNDERCAGRVSPCATVRPATSHNAVESSMLSRRTPEYAVRRMVSAISSAIDSSVLRKSSKPIGSDAMSDHLAFTRQVDDDVAVRVERRTGAGWDHAGRVVLLDDARPLARRRQIGPVDDRGLAPAELGAEVHAALAAGAPGP